jgi:hypothetical protein
MWKLNDSVVMLVLTTTNNEPLLINTSQITSIVDRPDHRGISCGDCYWEVKDTMESIVKALKDE